jgi:phosphoribosylformimino-5-aminoimidazole carboxamide ribonucleotide (ProFAR) isomerase
MAVVDARQLASLFVRQTALDALGAWPGGLQMGGGVSTDNARSYLDAGASHVIVTSFVFREGRLDEDRLKALVRDEEDDLFVVYNLSKECFMSW